MTWFIPVCYYSMVHKLLKSLNHFPQSHQHLFIIKFIINKTLQYKIFAVLQEKGVAQHHFYKIQNILNFSMCFLNLKQTNNYINYWLKCYYSCISAWFINFCSLSHFHSLANISSLLSSIKFLQFHKKGQIFLHHFYKIWNMLKFYCVLLTLKQN